MMPDPTLLDWVERLGGWGVVVYIVWWGTQHANKTRIQVDKMIETFRLAVQSFQTFEREERDAHEKILKRLQDIHDAVRDGNHAA